jgi:glucokinase
LETCLAVDVGGTKIALAVFAQDGSLQYGVQTAPVPFTAQGAGDPVALADMVSAFARDASQQGFKPSGLGLSLCGNVNLQTGEAVLTPNLHWRNLPFGAMLAQATGLPVSAATDVRCAALAELTWGAARGMDYFAWCTVGTGYGGYLVLDGELYDGYHGFAGPFGHITWDEEHGYPCGCGRKGCVETYVAGPAIARAGQLAACEGRSPRLAELSNTGVITTRQVFQAWREGDPGAIDIIRQVVRIMSINLGGVVTLLDLQAIVLGGGVVQAFPELVGLIDQRIRDFLMSEEARHELKVIGESFANAALVGAAAEFFSRRGML